MLVKSQIIFVLVDVRIVEHNYQSIFWNIGAINLRPTTIINPFFINCKKK